MLLYVTLHCDIHQSHIMESPMKGINLIPTIQKVPGRFHCKASSPKTGMRGGGGTIANDKEPGDKNLIQLQLEPYH